MHLLRAYCGDEIREMELTPGKAYSVGGGQKCDLVLESFQSTKSESTYIQGHNRAMVLRRVC